MLALPGKILFQTFFFSFSVTHLQSCNHSANLKWAIVVTLLFDIIIYTTLNKTHWLKHTVKCTQEWQRTKYWTILKWSFMSLHLNLIEKIEKALKDAVWRGQLQR